MKNLNRCQKEIDELQELRRCLEEAEETLRAIREGEIDGLIVNSSQGEQVFTLVGADHPYRLLIEEMNEGALTLALDGTILYCNRSFAQMIKINHQKLIGASFIEMIHPSNRQIFEAGWAGNMRCEMDLARGDGLSLPVHLSINPMWVEGQKNFSLVITDLSDMKESAAALKLANDQLCQKIVERTRTEKKLRKSEQEKDEILDSITDAFFALDRNWQITYWNNAAEKMFYLNREEVLGKVFWDVFPEAIGSVYYKQYHQAMETNQPVAFESFGIYTDLWVEARAYPSPAGLTIYLHNITKRKLAEAELRSSEETFYKTFHSSPAMMSVVHLESGCYKDVNNSWTQILEYSKDEVIGRTHLELNLHPDFNQHIEALQAMHDSEKLSHNTLLRSKSGKIINCVCSEVIIELGGESCILTNFIDITEIKRMEKEINRLDRLNLIGEMAASIGHEIRNPMTSIRGFLQILSTKNEYADDKAYFDLMIEELDRANDIITEFLSMARDKKIDLQPQYLDEVVKSLYPIIQADAIYQEKNVHLTLEKPPMPLIDAKEIRQLILNLARNGLEAMSPGGLLTIGTTVENEEIVLFVKDQGSGLSPDIIDKLGTPFITTKENGTGLGLAVCYSIAARHNARISFKTDSDGTVFKVYFPIPAEQITLF
ncbi:MAG: PAS domain S-box protein [Syntrophomonas sp.]